MESYTGKEALFVSLDLEISNQSVGRYLRTDIFVESMVIREHNILLKDQKCCISITLGLIYT
jgi:hypothetical protein